MGQEFTSLLHSSLSCAGQEVVTGQIMRFAADTLAHGAMGLVAAVMVLLRGYDVRWAQGALALIVVKEFAFDMPNGDWSALVVADSVWDVASYLVAFLYLWWALMASREASDAWR